tara:strand:+ start:396 stop:653 length:258 start_codon:yes stop_codon:yes gene_type:complete
MVFNNFIKIHKIFKKNKLEIKRIESFDYNKKTFWFLCLNNPRFAFGDNDLPDDIKCNFLNNNNNYFLKDEIKVVDYILRQYEKKI